MLSIKTNYFYDNVRYFLIKIPEGDLGWGSVYTFLRIALIKFD